MPSSKELSGPRFESGQPHQLIVFSYALFSEQTRKLFGGEAKPELTSDQLPLEQEMLGRRKLHDWSIGVLGQHHS